MLTALTTKAAEDTFPHQQGTIVLFGSAGTGKSWLANLLLPPPTTTTTTTRSLEERFPVSCGVESIREAKSLPSFIDGWVVCDTPPLFDSPENNAKELTRVLLSLMGRPSGAVLPLVKICFVTAPAQGRVMFEDILTARCILRALAPNTPYSFIVNKVNVNAADDCGFKSTFEAELRARFPENPPEHVAWIPVVEKTKEAKEEEAANEANNIGRILKEFVRGMAAHPLTVVGSVEALMPAQPNLHLPSPPSHD